MTWLIYLMLFATGIAVGLQIAARTLGRAVDDLRRELEDT